MARAFMFRGTVPRHGIGSSIAIIAGGYRDDTMIPITFSVPFTGTTNVSGGGGSLQTAINAAIAGTRLLIMDSLAYSPVTFTSVTDLTVEADAGQTPSITAAAGAGNHCATISTGNSGIALRGFSFIGSGNAGSGNQTNDGLVNMNNTIPSFDRLIVENCTFSEPAATAASGAPGIQLVGTNGLSHTNVSVHHCTFKNNSASATAQLSGYGACTIGGFNIVFVQNNLILRQNAVITRAASSMRGVVMKNLDTLVEDVLCEDIGTAGSNEAFKHNDELIFGTANGNSSWRNCVAFNCKRGYRATLTSGGMKVSHSVFYNNVAGIAAGQIIMRRDNVPSLFVVEDDVIQSAGDGTAFSGTVVTENNNDVFNVAAPGKVLDPSDFTLDSLPFDVANRIFFTTNPPLQTGGSLGRPIGVRYSVAGEKIFWVGTPLGT
jgi:hypothetical protein